MEILQKDYNQELNTINTLPIIADSNINSEHNMVSAIEYDSIETKTKYKISFKKDSFVQTIFKSTSFLMLAFIYIMGNTIFNTSSETSIWNHIIYLIIVFVVIFGFFYSLTLFFDFKEVTVEKKKHKIYDLTVPMPDELTKRK